MSTGKIIWVINNFQSYISDLTFLIFNFVLKEAEFSDKTPG